MASPPPPGNFLLANLPADTLEQLTGLLSPVDLEVRHMVWEVDGDIDFVYFPHDCVISIVAVDEECGDSVEVGTVGNEGFVGLPVFLGATQAPGRAFVQVAGQAQRMGAEDFRRMAATEGPLREALHRYTQAFITQVSQATACNRLHDARMRMARWLLMVEDRVGRPEFKLTHEFLGQMLGVRRATVSETAQQLQEAGLIEYQRGVIRVLDRTALEAASCSCYGIVRREFERLLGVGPA